jgi:hypothetical protein
MQIISRLALASGGALLLSLASVPLVQARQGADDNPSGSTTTTTETEVHSGSDDGNKPSGGSGNSGSGRSGGVDDNTRNRGGSSSSSPSDDSSHEVERLRSEAERHSSDALERVEKAKSEAKKRSDDAQSSSAKKLDDNKLKVCKNREKSIDSLMSRIGDRGTRHIALVDTISARIQQYVTTKQLTVTNYDALLASVASAKATAQSANATVKAAQPSFNCDGTDPAGAADSFKALTKGRDDAVKAYRDSVKALLVAVKAAQKAAVQPTPPAATSTTSTGSSQ